MEIANTKGAIKRRKLQRHMLNTELISDVPARVSKTAMRILAQDGRFEHITERVDKCTQQYPCNSKWCSRCNNKRNCTLQRQIGVDEQLQNEVCNATGTIRGIWSPNYRVRAGQRMIAPFAGLPNALMHTVTINLALEEVDGDLKAAADRFRTRLRKLFCKLSNGSIVRGKFDMLLKFADELAFDLEECDLPPELRGNNMPHERCGMLHIHLACFDPFLSSSELRELLVKEFPGAKRVCVRPPTKEIVYPNGTVTHGVQGYLEYLSMEKLDFSFGNESVDAVYEFATLDDTWTRANRNFSYGKRSKDTIGLIDPNRVAYLKAQRRNNDTRKKFKSLPYPVQWLHWWMSNAKAELTATMTRLGERKWFKSSKYRYSINSNWSKGKVLQVFEMFKRLASRTPEFIGKLRKWRPQRQNDPPIGKTRL